MSQGQDVGFIHSAVFVDSEEELCRSMAESAFEGLELSEEVIITADRDRRRRIASLLGDRTHQVRFDEADSRYSTPRSAMHGLVKMLGDRRRRVRSIGEVRPGKDRHSEWIRYEAALNEVLTGRPVTGVCFYDTRLLSDHTRASMEETHPCRGAISPWEGSDAFRPPQDVVTDFPPRRIHPRREPDLLLTDVSELRPVRAAAADMAPPSRADDAALVVHELTAMALADASVVPEIRMWSEPDRVAVQIISASDSFADPFAGLRPARPHGNNVALWIAGQLADDFAVARTGPVSEATVVFVEDR